MDSFRIQKSPGSDRFLGLYSSSPSSSSSSLFELDEHDIFSIVNAKADAISTTVRNSLNPSPRKLPLCPFQAERNFGILAALRKESEPQNPKFVQRKPSFSSRSPSISSTSRNIPVAPKQKTERVGQHRYQSAPVNVPVKMRMQRRDFEEEDENDEMMLPPHEIVDRAQRKGEPLTTFSVLEGVGRTLKGRDLRHVRNVVLHKTDSKTLKEEKREELFENLKADEFIGWEVDVIDPRELSAKMLRKVKVNLNEISHNSAIGLVMRVIDMGVLLTEVYVDTVGDPEKY